MTSRRFLLTALVVCLASSAGLGQFRLKSVARLPFGFPWPIVRLVLGDTDHDGCGEIIYWTGPPLRWEIVEYRPVNNYRIVQTRVGMYPFPESLIIGNFQPCDIDDIDRDGRTDLVGEVAYSDGSRNRLALATVESRDSSSYPDSLNWWTVTPNSADQAGSEGIFFDLDRDSAPEILSNWGDSTAVLRNVGSNRESLVCLVPVGPDGTRFTVDDYDQNGRMDYTFKFGQDDYVAEFAGGNTYALVCSLHTGNVNVFDRFGGHDVDHNGRAEFFEVDIIGIGGMKDQHTLYQFEATGEHTYSCYSVDTAASFMNADGRSICADVDGDSLEEVVWSIGDRIHILKATGPHQYMRVSTWRRPSGIVCVCNAADFNGNGYKEIYAGGDTGSYVLEVEAIKVLYPDTTGHLVGGDTCQIRWRVFTPPRCDSVSLFLRSDTTIVNGFYRLDTIAHGLSPSESTYSWVVPDTTLDSARILAIAYGPGWQFDESDNPFRIAPAGMQEARVARPLDWALSVWPNPASGKTRVSFDVPRKAVVHVGLYDAAGRLAEEYASGELEPGRYQAAVRKGLAPGVYFLQLGAAGRQVATKLVVLR